MNKELFADSFKLCLHLQSHDSKSSVTGIWKCLFIYNNCRSCFKLCNGTRFVLYSLSWLALFLSLFQEGKDSTATQHLSPGKETIVHVSRLSRYLAISSLQWQAWASTWARVHCMCLCVCLILVERFTRVGCPHTWDQGRPLPDFSICFWEYACWCVCSEIHKYVWSLSCLTGKLCCLQVAEVATRDCEHPIHSRH